MAIVRPLLVAINVKDNDKGNAIKSIGIIIKRLFDVPKGFFNKISTIFSLNKIENIHKRDVAPIKKPIAFLFSSNKGSVIENKLNILRFISKSVIVDNIIKKKMTGINKTKIDFLLAISTSLLPVSFFIFSIFDFSLFKTLTTSIVETGKGALSWCPKLL